MSRLAKAEGIAVSRLPVSNAFHCSLTSPAAEKLAEQTTLPDRLPEPAIRLFSCMDGQEISAGHDLPKHFVRQVTARVNFVALVESLAGCSDILVEVGPGRVLSGLVDAITPNGSPACLPTESSPFQTGDLNGLLAGLFVNGLSINWPALYANRLVHPFIAPADRSFLTNPCENPLDMNLGDISTYQTPEQALKIPLMGDLSDLPRETLQAYLKNRGAFLSEVIKADLKHTAGAKAPGNIEPSLSSTDDGTITHLTPILIPIPIPTPIRAAGLIVQLRRLYMIWLLKSPDFPKKH